MIYIGIDDTDILGSRGTNQLARAIVRAAGDRWSCLRILRHQLLDDPRIPYTSKNGSASMTLTPSEPPDVAYLIDLCRRVMREWFIEGSDPGLCVADRVSPRVTDFGQRCKQAVVTQEDARRLAVEEGMHLEGLGGTMGGIIGALAAVGLAASDDDGRIIQLEHWPDDLSGPQPVETLWSRGLDVENIEDARPIRSGVVDVGKHLRPNRRQGRSVLYAERRPSEEHSDFYLALKRP